MAWAQRENILSPGAALNTYSSLRLQSRNQLSRGVGHRAWDFSSSPSSLSLSISLSPPHLDGHLPLGAEALNLPEITLACRRKAIFPPSSKCMLKTPNARHMPCAGGAVVKGETWRGASPQDDLPSGSLSRLQSWSSQLPELISFCLSLLSTGKQSKL